MLAHISIRNVLLIDALDMDVPDGLLVLTGETGAGKSILLDSFALALGGRSDAGLVGTHAEQASISLRFEIANNHPAFNALNELGFEADGELVLRRVLGRDGRSRGFINDQPVSIQTLRTIGNLLIDIHGQFETHGLLDHTNHMGYLDDYADLKKDCAVTAETYTTWQQARSAYEDEKQRLTQLKQNAEDLEFSITELDRLNPQTQEAEALAEKRTRMQQKEKIAEALQAAYAEMQDIKIANARRILSRAAEKSGDMLNTCLEHLSTAEDALAEAESALTTLMRSDDYDVHALEHIEERLFALRAMARKYQCQPDDLAVLAEKFRQDLTLLHQSDAHLEKLRKSSLSAHEAYMKKAEALHHARAKAAKNLEKAMQDELPPLKLERARLAINVDKLADGNSTGISRVSFSGATNPDLPAGPLNKIASGGELARFMLALRLCLAETASTTTLIFDEVDTGIGGATADAVGERLFRLGKTMQTLVITHSPQVAARGNAHWRVEKQFEKNTSRTRVISLSHDARREEIARMLAGSTVTDVAREAAESLLNGNASKT